ncbi:MAG: hypothetical protein MI861_11735, partial [Pirellulales bacterium]|nr:hypothetical protein [Pirellulales bacterium]
MCKKIQGGVRLRDALMDFNKPPKDEGEVFDSNHVDSSGGNDIDEIDNAADLTLTQSLDETNVVNDDKLGSPENVVIKNSGSNEAIQQQPNVNHDPIEPKPSIDIKPNDLNNANGMTENQQKFLQLLTGTKKVDPEKAEKWVLDKQQYCNYYFNDIGEQEQSKQLNGIVQSISNEDKLGRQNRGGLTFGLVDTAADYIGKKLTRNEVIDAILLLKQGGAKDNKILEWAENGKIDKQLLADLKIRQKAPKSLKFIVQKTLDNRQSSMQQNYQVQHQIQNQHIDHSNKASMQSGPLSNQQKNVLEELQDDYDVDYEAAEKWVREHRNECDSDNVDAEDIAKGLTSKESAFTARKQQFEMMVKPLNDAVQVSKLDKYEMFEAVDLLKKGGAKNNDIVNWSRHNTITHKLLNDLRKNRYNNVGLQKVVSQQPNDYQKHTDVSMEQVLNPPSPAMQAIGKAIDKSGSNYPTRQTYAALTDVNNNGGTEVTDQEIIRFCQEGVLTKYCLQQLHDENDKDAAWKAIALMRHKMDEINQLFKQSKASSAKVFDRYKIAHNAKLAFQKYIPNYSGKIGNKVISKGDLQCKRVGDDGECMYSALKLHNLDDADPDITVKDIREAAHNEAAHLVLNGDLYKDNPQGPGVVKVDKKTVQEPIWPKTDPDHFYMIGNDRIELPWNELKYQVNSDNIKESPIGMKSSDGAGYKRWGKVAHLPLIAEAYQRPIHCFSYQWDKSGKGSIIEKTFGADNKN